ncbi:glycosyl hydrolases family 38 N-terminal domain-containing protein [Mycena olivaceomarginata]|nr:glycosyl hydrolases family 38 N-terminal domain-containing protein [Mycena olivaceomarginata]
MCWVWGPTPSYFGKDWDAINDGADVYDGADGEGEKGRSLVWGIGHCHIDTAWLWPYSVTQQKTARSWATQLDLMARYPEHRFACSQAQQFKWLEAQYPALFERIAAQVEAGKFHPIGGAWVEHDANMPSGEALVRQMVYGQRYFEKKFGVRCETGWWKFSSSWTLWKSHGRRERVTAAPWTFCRSSQTTQLVVTVRVLGHAASSRRRCGWALLPKAEKWDNGADGRSASAPKRLAFENTSTSNGGPAATY